MRRLNLSTKLLAAALPLIVAVGAMLALTIRDDLGNVSQAEKGAELGSVWVPLISALEAVDQELAAADAAAATTIVDPSQTASLSAGRRTTDQAINEIGDAIVDLGAFTAAGEHLSAARSSLSAARRNIDMTTIAPDMQAEIDPTEVYDQAGRELVAVGQLLPSEAGDAALGRELLAVVKLAEAKLASNSVIHSTQKWAENTNDPAPLATARASFSQLEAVLGEFVAIAPDDWAAEFRQSGFTTQLAQFRRDLDNTSRAMDTGAAASWDTNAFQALVASNVAFQSSISNSIVDRATAEADATRQSTLTRSGIILGVVLLAVLLAWLMTRSITRRIKAVAKGANQVTSEQLPALVEALRDPRGKSVIPDIDPIKARGNDELTELAHAFNSMQDTLVDVAHEQVEVLRRGVSDIFITMARRNRSLIDRQLAMLDEYEAEVDDPAVLSNYYQLDHLATRMRRNSESLLVLANAEPKRRRVKATEIDDVVRASIGEVEDYRRIEVEALESLQVRGNVVADISHLLAELLDNATSFSPPDSAVRVGGRRAGDSYMLRIVDAGVGVPTERLHDLNELLREPPIVGLSVESTLGMSVVSLLANKYNIGVTLSAGNPGLVVDVVLPSELFGPIDATPDHGSMPSMPSASGAATREAAEPLVAWNDAAEQSMFDAGVTVNNESFEPSEPDPISAQAEPILAAAFADDDEPRVAPSDWTKMSLNLSAFKSGQSTALEPEDAGAADDEVTADADAEAEAEADGVDAALAAFEPVADEAPEPQPAPVMDQASIASSLAAALGTSSLGTPPASDAPRDLPPPPSVAPAAPAPHGEFDIPPAPPLTPGGPSSRPVTPTTARPVPHPAEPVAALSLSLPTRTPARAAGTDGPDRLADALNALPTRAASTGMASPIDDAPPITQSRLDPEALRDRLRSFQTEFTSGLDSPTDGDNFTTYDQPSDLGGDRR